MICTRVGIEACPADVVATDQHHDLGLHLVTSEARDVGEYGIELLVNVVHLRRVLELGLPHTNSLDFLFIVCLHLEFCNLGHQFRVALKYDFVFFYTLLMHLLDYFILFV